jgi:hypothetical protein
MEIGSNCICGRSCPDEDCERLALASQLVDPFSGGEAKQLTNEGAIDANAPPGPLAELIAALGEQALQRAHARILLSTFNARNGRLGHGRTCGELALRQPSTPPRGP